MNPTEYEHLVAAMLTGEGWDSRVTPASHDHGIDVLATRDGVRLAVQAKMYGDGRPVNEEVVLISYGAAHLAECTEIMIATDGQLTPNARRAAAKLGVTVRLVPASSPPISQPLGVAESLGDTRLGFGVVRPGSVAAVQVPFGEFWERDIVPLAGQVLRRDDGRENGILRVDGGGVLRTTSSGTRQLIGIEIFRWVFDRLAAGISVTREEINERDARRVSSGVVLILSSSPSLEVIRLGRKMALRMVATGDQAVVSQTAQLVT